MMVKRDSKGAKNMLYICGRKCYHQRFVAVFLSRSLLFSFAFFIAVEAKNTRINCCASTIISIIIFAFVVIVFVVFFIAMLFVIVVACLSLSSALSPLLLLFVVVQWSRVYANDCWSWNVNYTVYIRDIRSTMWNWRHFLVFFSSHPELA